MARRRRELSEADLTLWRRVTETAVPLTPDRALPTVPPPPASEPGQPNAAAPWPERNRGASPAPKPSKPARPTLDARRMERLRRGAMRPEARIDLHGMTLAEAKPALTGFVMRCEAEGRRLVLVITGKGRGGGTEDRGALRRQVPHWLRLAPLAPLVLEVLPAHRRHGGEGALYVYLRRRR